ncbi:hypothetical protein AYJ54_01085 [Bradyrhizobium centrolobii]|uniref:Phasin domain-containing protein n=1 Tax=Bradyrhizobium centrolobii TaxID=1505087 RepID=A0A176YH59_9BRAD|nr:phasin family protein [Bradyrhizobium centrolobii]OAF05530.1 hypothetical protein AYJ54_01085 [Bradyrhizobium centrolobii]
MLSAHENKPTGKSGQRGRKKKAGQRTATGEHHATAAHQLPADASAEISQEIGQKIGQEISSQASPAAALPGETSGMEIAASAPVDLAPVGVQTIADVYSDYTRKSLEHAWSFLGKLATARSPAEAFELQMEFAKEAYESFVAGSQKIADLHGQLAMQRVMHLEGFVAKLTQTTLEIRATRH